MHKKYDAALKEKTDAYFKADQEARTLRFSEQTLRQEVLHLKSVHEDEKMSFAREMQQLREQQERELEYIAQIKEASLEKMQTTHSLQLKRVQEKLSETMSDNERLAQQCQALKARLEDKERTVQDEVETAKEEMQGELTKARKNVTEMKSQITEKDDEISHLSSTLDRTKSALSAQERELHRLETELLSARQRASDLERSFDAKSRQKTSKDTSLSAELDLAQRQARISDEENVRLKDEMSHLRGDFELAERENEELKVKLRQKLVNEMRADIETLRKKASFEQERGSTSLIYKEKIGKQEMEIANLTLQLQDLDLRAQSADSIQQRLTADLQQKDKEVMRLKSTVHSLKTELEKANEERDQLMEVSGSLRAELNLMRGSVEGDPRGSVEVLGRRGVIAPYTQPMEEMESSVELPPVPTLAQTKPSLPKYDRFEEMSISPPVKDSHLSTLKRKISQVKSELDQNFDLSAQGAKPRSRLFARLEDTPASSLANTQSFDDKD